MPSAALVLDHERDLLVPDKATLCALSHQSPGSYEAFGLLILPKGAVQSFDDAPGHYLVAGTNEDVKRQILPAKVDTATHTSPSAGGADALAGHHLVFNCGQPCRP